MTYVYTQTIHVWYTYLYTYIWLIFFYGFHVGKYTSHMDPMGYMHIYLIHIYIYTIYAKHTFFGWWNLIDYQTSQDAEV